MDKNKKYPEPDDIDENLVNSKIDPIPDIEQHNQIKKIEIDDMNQFDLNNNDNENVDVNMKRTKKIYIDDKLRTWINGKITFPIGLYAEEYNSTHRDNWVNSPFNMIFNGGSSTQMIKTWII